MKAGTIQCRINEDKNPRAVLDPLSEISIITSFLLSRLGLPTTPTTVHVGGICLSLQKSLGNVFIHTFSIHSSPVAYILLTGVRNLRPTSKVEITYGSEERFHFLELADPQFSEPSQIQLQLGEVYFGCYQMKSLPKFQTTLWRSVPNLVSSS